MMARPRTAQSPPISTRAADGPLAAVLLAVGVDPVGSTRHVIGGQLERVEMG
jgi:hypothetical protein